MENSRAAGKPKEERSLAYSHTIRGTRYVFPDLRTLLARATPFRSGDALAGIAAGRAEQTGGRANGAGRPAAGHFLAEPLIPYETDEVTRLIFDSHDAAAFAPVASLTVGEFREWLLATRPTRRTLAAIRAGVTPEMAAAVSKIMRLQDLIAAAGEMPRRHRVPQHHRPAGHGCRCACSPTIRPTTCRASPPRCSTACCSAAATR